MAHTVFISYAAQDEEVADAVCAALEGRNIRCWIAPRDVMPGVAYTQALIDALNQSRIMVLVLSSSANGSPQVMREVERAVNKGIPIILLRVEDAKPSIAMNYFLSAPHWYDIRTPPFDEHLQRVADKVQALLAGDGKSGDTPAMRKKKLVFLKSGNVPLPEPPRLPSMMCGANGPVFSGRTEIPDQVMERVRFSVTSPHTVCPSTSFLVDVWAHLEIQREAVIKRALEAAAGAELMVKSKGPVLLARGGFLTVRLRLEGLIVDDPEDIILWDGEIGNANFLVTVPADVRAGSANGVATIHMNGLQITRIYFIIKLGRKPSQTSHIHSKEKQYRTAFASYASADRDEVLPRIQGIQKVAPRLRIFLDVLSLRSGEDWKKRLWEVIPRNDIFYLFWSDNARKSEWVEEEWRCALKTRGLDFIDPVPLVSPEEVPPPPELATKHFSDWILAFARNRK